MLVFLELEMEQSHLLFLCFVVDAAEIFEAVEGQHSPLQNMSQLSPDLFKHFSKLCSGILAMKQEHGQGDMCEIMRTLNECILLVMLLNYFANLVLKMTELLAMHVLMKWQACKMSEFWIIPDILHGKFFYY